MRSHSFLDSWEIFSNQKLSVIGVDSWLDFAATLTKYLSNSNNSIKEVSDRELSDLISQFNQWKSDLVSDPEIMGGQTVFPNSRLTVQHIGKIIDRGESLQVIREDYPYLSDLDLKFAPLYVKAYPVMGRPKKG